MTRRPDLPRFANVRTGDMVQCNEHGPRRPDMPRSGPWQHPPHTRPRLHPRWFVVWAISFALAVGIAALAVGDVPPHYEAQMGYDVCKTAKC